VPVLPVCLLEPLWDQFSALLPERPLISPTHPLGCHRPRISDRVVFEHVIAALVHGSGYERIASSGCSSAPAPGAAIRSVPRPSARSARSPTHLASPRSTPYMGLTRSVRRRLPYGRNSAGRPISHEKALCHSWSEGLSEPMVRLELTACRLRGGCSTTELHRHAEPAIASLRRQITIPDRPGGRPAPTHDADIPSDHADQASPIGIASGLHSLVPAAASLRGG
jgi:hypothetical protein